jgi:hypothetical protein
MRKVREKIIAWCNKKILLREQKQAGAKEKDTQTIQWTCKHKTRIQVQ